MRILLIPIETDSSLRTSRLTDPGTDLGKEPSLASGIFRTDNRTGLRQELHLQDTQVFRVHLFTAGKSKCCRTVNEGYFI